MFDRNLAFLKHLLVALKDIGVIDSAEHTLTAATEMEKLTIDFLHSLDIPIDGGHYGGGMDIERSIAGYLIHVIIDDERRTIYAYNPAFDVDTINLRYTAHQLAHSAYFYLSAYDRGEVSHAIENDIGDLMVHYWQLLGCPVEITAVFPDDHDFTFTRTPDVTITGVTDTGPVAGTLCLHLNGILVYRLHHDGSVTA